MAANGPLLALAGALLAMPLAGCSTLEQRANGAAVADGVTTLAAVAAGATELNPLGLATVVLKYPALEWIKTQPADEQPVMYAAAGSIWGAAAVSNGCMLAALATGGAFAPVCFAIGIGYGLREWSASKPEREFYMACAAYRQVSGGSFRCAWQMSNREGN